MNIVRTGFAAVLVALAATSASASQVGPASVRSGTPVVVLSYASVDPETCYFMTLPTLRVIRPPAHGTLTLGKQRRSAGKGVCADKAVTASTATYRSSSGFRGRDEMIIEAETEIYTDGTGRRSDSVHIILDVK
jgi:hypothetical protein